MAYLVVLTTVPSRRVAQRLTRLLLEKRLAACINVSAVESHYWWQKKIDHAREFLLLIKTRRNLFAKLEKTLRAHHPYSTPEVIALPIQKGNAAYLAWLKTETAKPLHFH